MKIKLQANWRTLLLSVLFILSLVISLSFAGCFNNNKPLVIAVVGGMSGESKAEGEEMIKGAQMYIDEVNQVGGVNGKKLKIVAFDDKNEPDLARAKAQEIAQKSQALVVLGHNYSSTSIPGGEMYKQFGVPAITGTATAEKVTEGNDWYFRVIGDNPSQGMLIANYIKKIMNQPKVTLISDDREAYSKSIAAAFEKEFQAVKGQITYNWTINGEADNLDQQVEQIITELLKAKPEDVGVIFLPLVEEPAIRLIVAMKRQGLFYSIVGGDTLSGGAYFLNLFKDYPEERQHPGFFTDGIYAISPIIYDVLGEEGQEFKNKYIQKYRVKPTWVAATHYNAAKVAVAAIKMAGVGGQSATLKQDRQKIRGALAAINSSNNAVAGLDGPLFFTKERNVVKPTAVGIISGQQLISAFTQLSPITSPKTPTELEQGIKASRIIQLGEQYLYKTDVVYTGMKIYQISDLDLDKKTYTLDFDLWFRYQGELPVNNLDFLNAVKPINLGKPLEASVKNGINYRLYNVKATLRADFLPNRKFGEHILGVSFINNTINRNNLIYVIDVIGLGNANDKSYVETLQNSDLLNQSLGWKIDQASLFQDTTQKESLGNPESLSAQFREGRFSRFNLSITLVKDEINLRKMIPFILAVYLVILSGIMAGLMLAPRKYRLVKTSEVTTWILQTISVILFVFSLEAVLIEWLGNRIGQNYVELILLIFNTLWWLIPAFMLSKAIEYFIWRPLEKNTGQPIPSLVRRMVLLVIYSLAFFGVICYVFNQPITSLLATSGLALTIIGLAIQINISNIFSGLAINLERTFQVGDFIEVYGGDSIGENISGFVVDINWRSTRIRTRSGNIVLMPNSQINDKTVINYMLPEKISRATITFCLPATIPSDKAISVLMTALKAVTGKDEKSPLAEPEPEVILGDATSVGINYHIKCWHIPSQVSLDDIKHTVTESVLGHLHQADIKLAYGDAN